MQVVNSGEWTRSNMQVFWGEIAPCDHVVQIYENEKIFLDSLEGFIGSGILAGDSTIIIVTAEHKRALESRLIKQGFDLAALVAADRYVALDASEMLAKFMVNDWPDEKLFFELITGLLKRVQKNKRKIRAFGEMVALLWEQGYSGATVQLETLWNQLHKKDEFTLFCAYPKIGFTQDMSSSLDEICCAHSKVVDGRPRPSTEIYYKIAT